MTISKIRHFDMPHPSDSPPRRFRFKLSTLLIGLTVIGLLLGVLGVPVTLYLAGWMAAMAIYFVVTERWGNFVGIIAFLAFIWLIVLALQAVHFAFR